MPSSRSRKRDSTLQTVDILNNIGTVNNALRPRVLPSRRKQPDPRLPRSDIWDVLESPEKSRNGRGRVIRSEPITPRRSARVRDVPSSRDAVREGLRSTRVDYHEDEEEDEDEEDQEEDQYEQQEGDEQEHQANEDNDDDKEIRLFPDEDTPQTRRSTRHTSQFDEEYLPTFPSPAALFHGQLIQSSTPSTPGANQNSDVTANRFQAQGGAEAEEANVEQLHRYWCTRSSAARSRPLSPIVQIHPARPQSAGQSKPRSSPPEQKAQANDGSKPQNAQADNVTGNSSSSDFQESDSSSSTQGSARYSDAEESFTQPQSNKRPRFERSSPSYEQDETLPNEEAGGQSLQLHEEAEDANNEEEEKARGLQWMEEAMNLGDQRENWLVLTRAAKQLHGLADPSLAPYFEDICAAIRELRELYEEIVDSAPSLADLSQCDNLFECIPCEGDRLLDKAYYMATQPDSSDAKDRAVDLVDEFEARVIPGMMKLIYACFKAYYTDPMLFPGVQHHFGRVLVLLLYFSNRINGMKTQQIVRGRIHNKGLGRALAALNKALQSRQLRRRDPGRREVSRDHTVLANDVGREWSRDEGLALIDGLRAYQGRSSLHVYYTDSSDHDRIRPLPPDHWPFRPSSAPSHAAGTARQSIAGARQAPADDSSSARGGGGTTAMAVVAECSRCLILFCLLSVSIFVLMIPLYLHL